MKITSTITFYLTAVFFLLHTVIKINAQDTAQRIIPDRFNSPEQTKKPYIILISVDGYRYDYATRYNAVNLLRRGATGVIAEGIKPGFPSLTFPNHYSIVTGLYPAHHGLIDNSFYDRQKQTIYNKAYRKVVQDSSWYGGRPLWVLAEQQQMLSAAFYWVGSEAQILGTKPTYTYNYSTFIPTDQRIAIIRNWLDLPAERRPHLICVYFEEVDYAGHLYGPDSPELGLAVKAMDSVLNILVETVEETGLPVNFIVLADHGMERIDDLNPLRLPVDIDKSGFIVPPGDALLHLYAKNKTLIKPTYKALRNNANGFRVYLHNELPAKWQYGGKDDRFNRVGDIVLIPQPGLVFNITNTKVDKGKHGFDPARKEMMAGFFAWGPAFKKGILIKSFDNVHVYPLISKILDLPVADKIDGKLNVLRPILQ